MMHYVAVITFIVFWLSDVRCASVPEPCQGILCEEGYFCEVRQVAECTPRFCPPPVGECVATSSKPGVCPNRLENRACLHMRGVPLCFVDSDCSDDAKCCEGCCKTADAEPSPNDQVEYTGKPGMCPVDPDMNAKRMWTDLYCEENDLLELVDECYFDDDCANLFKCCTGLCGNRCKRALSVSLSGSRT